MFVLYRYCSYSALGAMCKMDNVNSNNGENFRPYVLADKTVPEFTITAIIIGSILSVVFGAANAYLGLLIGTTISASIPAAVISMGIIRGVLKRDSILENNIVQTIASAGQAVASGAIFTLPVWFMWKDEWHLHSGPSIFVIASITLCGGLLGVCFMIPLRRALVVKEHGILPYPEGTACAEILIAGETGGSRASNVFAGLGISSIFKFIEDGFKLFPSMVRYPIPSYGTGVELNISPALLGVGYVCGMRATSYMMVGGLLNWFVIMPLIKLFAGNAVLFPGTVPISSMSYDQIYTDYIRYIGAGAVAAGGIMSLCKSLPTMASTFSKVIKNFSRNREVDLSQTDFKSNNVLRTDLDMPSRVSLFIILSVILYMVFVPNIPVTIAGTAMIAFFGFFFASVASRLVGLVGTTNNPVSGMTIATLLFTTVAFKLAGSSSHGTMISAIVIASIICVASSIAGDTSQDLKTGFIVGATPKYQQYAMIIGVVVSSLSIGGILYLFDISWGFGKGSILAAPQANLMKVITEGVMQNNLPWVLVIAGAFIAIAMEIVGLPSLPIAVGAYLRIGVSLCFFAGGLLRKLAENVNRPKTDEQILKRKESIDKGVLFSSGLIAGEGLIGVILAVLAIVPSSSGTVEDTINLSLFSLGQTGSLTMFGVIALSILAFTFRNTSSDKKNTIDED